MLNVVCPVVGGTTGSINKSGLTATVGWKSVGSGVKVVVGALNCGSGVDCIGVLMMPLSAPGVAVMIVGVTFWVGALIVLVGDD